MSKLAWIAKLLVSIALVWWLLHNFSFAPVIGAAAAWPERRVDRTCRPGIRG